MGQAQSGATAVVSDDHHQIESPRNSPSQPSLAAAGDNPPPPSSASSVESLLAEAAAYGNDENNESLDARAQKALECPCVADLQNGLCGTQFSDAFLCFLKSTAEEKGSECVRSFVALQNCIKTNPNAFSKDVFDENEVKKEESPSQGYKIIPPLWSRESRSQKSKL